MSKLIYFRHAQASYGKPDYDQLSEKGYLQSEILGRHLAEGKTVFDHIYVGPLKRHRQTLSKVQEAYANAGLPLPAPITMQELDEHRGPDILKQVLHELKNDDPQIGEWEAIREKDPSQNVKMGLLIFDRAMELWATGALEKYQPSKYLNWSQFKDQVARGYQQVLKNHASEKGVTIGLFTSGGTISAIMGHTLGIAENRDIIKLNGVVQNTSKTEIMFSGSRVTLKRFNEVSHLPEDLKTYV